MRSLSAWLVFAVAPFFSCLLAADVLFVNDTINLSGSGSVGTADCCCGTGEGFSGSVEYSLTASGSNGTDSVYLYVIDVTIPPLALPMADPLTAGLDQCMDGESFQPLCSAAIDGVVGYGGFTNLGG